MEYEIPDSNTIGHKYGMEVIKQSSKKMISISDEIKHGSEIIDKTEVLMRKLLQKDNEIEKLCTLLECLQPVAGLDAERLQKYIDNPDDTEGVVDYRDSKIVSLAKKNRSLSVQLTKAKSSAESRALQILELSEQINKLETNTSSAGINIRGPRNRKPHDAISVVEEVEDKDQVISTLRMELTTMGKSNEDLKKKSSILTDEVKQLTRVLEKEIGNTNNINGVTVSQAVAAENGWRGRAQQIVMLKAKVAKLESVIASYQVVEGAGDSVERSASSSSTRPRVNQLARIRVNNVDMKAESDLLEMSRDRKQAVECVIEERDNLIRQLEVNESKVISLKSRIKILESDSMQLKQNLRVVLSAKDADDELVKELQEECHRLRMHQKNTTLSSNLGSTNNNHRNHGGLIESVDDGSHTELIRLQRLVKQQQEQLQQ